MDDMTPDSTTEKMRIHFPGLIFERNRNGSPRIRVRVKGERTRRITIPVDPDHPDFPHYYYAARVGEIWQPPHERMAAHSLDDLCHRYLAHLENMVTAGQMSPLTLKQRRSVLTRLCDHKTEDGYRYGEFDMDAPTSAFVDIRDAWAARPAAADNLMKAVRAAYEWAITRKEITHNPAAGIAPIHTASRGGATPWTPADLRKFKARWPEGTTPHLWLTLQAFTACRIGDAVWLGRDQEVTRNGQVWLDWRPRKKGSAFVSIPMLPPLFHATRAAKVVGPAYLLREDGRPFSSSEALRVRVQRWCEAAGIKGRSSHGIRKAVAQLMAEAGASQHQIMAVMAHTQAQTSEIYTKGAQRRVLAADGLQALASMEW